nr:uncharacterized protein LOC113728936 [Coffea arabica]
MWIYNSKGEIELQKGQLFTNVDAFRAALKDYVIQKGFPILRLKNEKSRVTAVCGVEGCQWRIHASAVADSVTFHIKSYQPKHTCVMDKQCAEATSDWMAKKLVFVMRDHLNMTSKGVETEAELLKYAQKLGFLEGCRPFVGFDGCFLKGPFDGVLLTAVALDANNNIFPLAFAVAECESKDTWRWFFYYFSEFFGPFDHSKPLTFMSDRQKLQGLNLAYEEMIPEAIGRIVEKLKEISQALRKCHMHMASEDTFEVGDMDRTYIVNLRQRIWDYGAFQISGIPCKHATLGVIYRREKLEKYYGVWFTKDMYLKTYSHMIHPIPHMKRWPPMPEVLPTTVLPPPLRRAPGRPRVNRRREADETACTAQAKRSNTLKCGNCGAFGHNKRTCKGAPVQKSSSNTTPTEQDHATRNVPIVHSSQGSNPSPPSQNGAAHIQVNVQTTATTHANKKRGRRFGHNPATSVTEVGGRAKNFNSALTNLVVLVPPTITSQNASSWQNLFVMEKDMGEFHDSPLRLEEAMVAAKTFNSEL